MRRKRTQVLIAALMIAVLLSFTACNSSSKNELVQNESEQNGSSPEPTKEADNSSDTLDFPKKDIKLIVPFAAGGGTDTMARIFAKAAGKDYLNGHAIVVENMGGGGAVIGQTYVANTAEPDGYTLMVFTSSAINNTLLKEVKYSYEDFKPIVGCNPDAEILVVPTDSPYNTLEEFISAAKTANMKVSTPGHSSGHHIRAMNMARILELKYDYIHNDSAAKQVAQILGGHCDIAYMTASEAASSILDGKMKAIGIMSKERDETLPDVPTFLEQGYEGWVDGANRGIACSKDVPEDVYNYLVEEFGKIANSDAFVSAMRKAGKIPGAQSPAEYQAYINFTADGVGALKPLLQEKK